MARPHKVLRDLLHEHEITGEILARELRLGTATISRKLNGHSFWTSDEMWRIMSLVEEPSYRLHEIFPIGGKNERKGA